MATITLVLPNYTLTAPGPVYSAAQLGFVSIVTILLYAVFLYTQTMRHRDYFVDPSAGLDDHGAKLSRAALALSCGLLLLALLAVVLLAKKFSLVVDAAGGANRAPPALVGGAVGPLGPPPGSQAPDAG